MTQIRFENEKRSCLELNACTGFFGFVVLVHRLVSTSSCQYIVLLIVLKIKAQSYEDKPATGDISKYKIQCYSKPFKRRSFGFFLE